MKRPSITKGEWHVEGYSDGSIGISCEGHMICEVNDAYREVTPNAKAISAVPDMIEALMFAKIVIDKFEGGDLGDLERGVCVDQINQALKKAGVNDEATN